MSAGTGNYTVKERGRNGIIDVQRDSIIRVFKRLGRDATDVIPLSRVRSVDHDSQFGGDVVTLKTADAKDKWKTGGDKESTAMANEIERYSDELLAGRRCLTVGAYSTEGKSS